MTTKRRRRPLAATAAVFAFLALLAPARAAVGPRVTVAVYGDSIVEAYTIPGYLENGLVPALGTGLVRSGGFARGGTGLVPVTPFRMRFNHYTVLGGSPPNPVGWVLAGYASHGEDGPSGYSGLAYSPQATATAPIGAPMVAVLYTKYAGSGPFTVTAGTSSWTIDGRTTGPPTPTEQWLAMPAGASTITVHGPSTGVLVFDGLIERRPVAPGTVQVEMENLGHMGHSLTDDSAPRTLRSLADQRFDVSIFLAEYIYQYSAQYSAAGSGTRYEQEYVRQLRAFAGQVRAYGGLCLIADSSPVPIKASVLAAFAAINRREGRTLGCAVTGALSRLWNPTTSVRDGLTLVDGSHPTKRGYQRMVAALAPAVVPLIRQRLRARAG